MEEDGRNPGGSGRRFGVAIAGTAGVLLALWMGLRYENVVGSLCAVCASERTVRQRGFALSEGRRLWDGEPTEEIEESEVARDILGPGHVHSWETWSNLYVALNGLSGGHPGLHRMNPAARAWRFHPRFRITVRNVAGRDSANRARLAAMFELASDPAGGTGADGPDPAVMETAVRLFQESGEAIPPGWGPAADPDVR